MNVILFFIYILDDNNVSLHLIFRCLWTPKTGSRINNENFRITTSANLVIAWQNNNTKSHNKAIKNGYNVI